MKAFALLVIFTTLGMFVTTFSDDQQDANRKGAQSLAFTMKSIDGEEVDLAEKYDGKVVVIVNVASKCGLTPQYTALQELHEKYADKGLAILGFPSNQFGGQEPGSESEIKAFCTDTYNVEFDLFAKIEVNGKNRCDLYTHLTQLDAKPKGAGDVQWNFEKFVINRKGEVVGRFQPRLAPDSPEFVATIEKALAENH